jgi:tRNA (guanine-N7-)-methyltransferase
MWRAALVAQKEDLKNVAFIQSDIRQLDKYFNESSIEELWITFPDPYPKKKQAKHRMTGPDFLPVYKKLLSPKGIINFKTDDPSLFRWSLEEFVKAKLEFLDLTFDLYGDKTRTHAKTLTTFEKRWLAMGKKVHYAKLCFK